MSIADTPTPFPPIALPTSWTLAQLQEHLGGVPLERILLYPPPGMATEADVLRLEQKEDRLCELVDGVLVEKTMSSYESILAMALGFYLNAFLQENDLGVVTGPDGQLRILPSQIRIPDVAFISWDRFPGGKLPQDRIFQIVPDLAVEVISEGNSEREMEQKLAEYFKAGVRLVWYIDPRSRSARTYTGVDQESAIDESGILDGGDVLPGFSLRLGDLFERADRRRN